MLEVCFNDSVKAALKIAQHYGDNKSIGCGAIGIITNKKGVFSFFAKRKALKEYKKRQEELQKQAVSLSGKKGYVVGLSFGLSEGDIKAPIVLKSCPRKEYVYSSFSFDRYSDQKDVEKSINQFWEYCIDDLEKLKENKEPIRIWVDNTPDARCGLLFITDLLKNSEIEIHIVELPQQIKQNDNCIIEYRGWSDVEPQMYGTFFDRERTLTKDEINALSDCWQKLKEENTSLRVVKNGVVISANESYYDDLIREVFPKDTCKISHIIGNALGEHKILTGDVLIAKRVRHFIDTGELEIIKQEKDGFYSWTVRAAK